MILTGADANSPTFFCVFKITSITPVSGEGHTALYLNTENQLKELVEEVGELESEGI